MNDKEVKNMLEEMIVNLESIKKDIEYGVSLDSLPPHNFIKASVELNMMSNRLFQISEQVCEQTIVKDFE